MVNRELDQGVKDQIAHRCDKPTTFEHTMEKTKARFEQLKEEKKISADEVSERRWRIEEHQRKLRVKKEEWEL